jgi:hypothetical protein
VPRDREASRWGVAAGAHEPAVVAERREQLVDGVLLRFAEGSDDGSPFATLPEPIEEAKREIERIAPEDVDPLVTEAELHCIAHRDHRDAGDQTERRAHLNSRSRINMMA